MQSSRVSGRNRYSILTLALAILLGIFSSGFHHGITHGIEVGSFKKEPLVEDDIDPVSQDDQELLPRQFTTVFEYLLNVSGFELPFILVLLDANGSVVGNAIVQSGENENVLSAMEFVCSEGAEEGLSYPMHVMVRDANENAAYGYLGDLDAQPEIQVVHVDEPE